MKRLVVPGLSAILFAACLTPDAVPSAERPDAGTGGSSTQSSSSSAGGGGGAGGSGGAATGDVLWGQAFGAQFSHQRVSGVALDPMDDSIFVAGTYEGAFSFTGMEDISHAGNNDIFLAKFNPADGTYVWHANFGDFPHQYVTGVTTSADRHIHLTGYFEGDLFPDPFKLQNGGQTDVFVAKLDPEGAIVWTRKYGDGTGQPKIATSIAVDTKGNTLVTGYFEGSLEFIPSQPINAMNRDVFLAKLDKDGNPLWSKRLGNGSPGGPPNHLLCRVAVDHQDNIVLETAFAGTMSLGAPLDPVGSVGTRAILLAKFDPDGVPLWQKVFGSANAEQRSRALAVDSKDNILLTGDMAGTVNFGGEPLSTPSNTDADLFVAKFAPDGKHVWSKRAGSIHPQEGRAIAVDGADNVIVTGSYYGVLQFTGDEGLVNSELGGGNWDLFALKLAPDGQYIWAKRFGAGSHQIAEGMAIDREGRTVFAGSFDGAIPLPDQTLTGKGYDDIFVIKIAP